jgi:hypothetical protein
VKLAVARLAQIDENKRIKAGQIVLLAPSG